MFADPFANPAGWLVSGYSLVLWSLSAVLFYVAILALVLASAPNARLVPAVGLPVAQLVLIYGQMAAVRAARSGSGWSPRR